MFVQQEADFAANFFEKVLRHSADEWYGKPFLLAPWEEYALSQIFGNLAEDGRRLIEMAYLEVPKKAGKSEFVAGIILLLLFMETMPGCQVYGAASATRQALNVYRAAAKMVEQSPILRKRFRILRSTNRIIKYSDPDSFYAAIAADGDLGDGVNPSFVVADEVHRWRTRKQLENWDVLSNGGITRKQTLTIAITTAGVMNESPLAWRLHEKTRKIERGIVADPKFFGKIWGADPGDDPASDATYIKANPSLKQNGGFLDIQILRDKYTSLSAEGDLTSFKRYFLNIWDQKENLAIPMDRWDAGAGDWQAQGLVKNPAPIVLKGQTLERKARPIPAELMTRFIDRKCWPGVDLSMTTDTTAVVFVFPCADGSIDLLPFFWLPDARILELERKLGVPLRRWADEGFLELSPGEVIDYRDVQARLEWGAQMFDVQEICWDPWNSRQISVQMLEDGHRCYEVPQGFKHLSEPTKKLLALIYSKKVHHGGHPLLRWQAGCATTVEDGRDNVMFAKPNRMKSASRIDGIAATTNAMYKAIVHLETKKIPYTGVRSF